MDGISVNIDDDGGVELIEPGLKRQEGGQYRCLHASFCKFFEIEKYDIETLGIKGVDYFCTLAKQSVFKIQREKGVCPKNKWWTAGRAPNLNLRAIPRFKKQSPVTQEPKPVEKLSTEPKMQEIIPRRTILQPVRKSRKEGAALLEDFVRRHANY